VLIGLIVKFPSREDTPVLRDLALGQAKRRQELRDTFCRAFVVGMGRNSRLKNGSIVGNKLPSYLSHVKSSVE
jgi:hypothetical protein